jgi:hypothetical protein
LWYGTLQVGPYLESRAHNPRFYFAQAAFRYTSMWWRPIEIHSSLRQCSPQAVPTQLVYWTDRDGQRRRVEPVFDRNEPTWADYAVPPQPNHTTLYYYFEQAGPAAAPFTTPAGGERNPEVLFISDEHLADLDRHHDLLDLFDLVRVLRHIAWQEPVPATDKVDLNHDGRIDAGDVEAMVLLAVPELAKRLPAPASRVEVAADAVTVRLADGSWISVPKEFGGHQTDLELSLHGEMAPALMSRPRSFTSLTDAGRGQPGDCRPAHEVTVNGKFYLGEPHGMQRYLVLAQDNIARDPFAFIAASLYRIPRLFIVRGSDDLSTTQQFRWSSLVYGAGTALSIGYLAIFVAGAVVAWRRRSPMLWLLVPIVYVPITICFVLTNMRYTVTVQPLMFGFVAVAMAAMLKLDEE